MIGQTQFSTAFLLFAQYSGRAIIPLEDVCRDYFSHLTPDKLLRKVGTGEIALPVVRIESSQKGHKGVHVIDLAAYIDERREAALKELRQLQRKDQLPQNKEVTTEYRIGKRDVAADIDPGHEMDTEDEFPIAFSPRSLAERWQCSERHVRNMVSRGDLPHSKLGDKLIRIKRTDVEEYERKGGS